MKSFIVLALCVAVAVAIPLDSSKDAVVIRNDLDNIGVGGYNYVVETSDGKAASESGQLQNIGTEDEALEVTGKFSYIGDDGVEYSVTYSAGKDGFNAQGLHLPRV